MYALTRRCPSGKVGWFELAEAWAQADQLRERFPLADGGIDYALKPYLCDQCGRWHVGHAQADLIERLRQHFNSGT